MSDRSVISHLDQCLAELAEQQTFCRKLEFATDTHSAENWLRTEIAYEVSRGFYEGSTGAAYWSHPERYRRTDIPILKLDEREVAALVELKMLYNRRGHGKSNRQKLEADRQKLLSQQAPFRVLIVALVFMEYVPSTLWQHLSSLTDMDAFTKHALQDLPEPVRRSCKQVDAAVKAWPHHNRPTFQVRFCRLLV